MPHPAHSSAFRFIAELLLYPEDRDKQKLASLAAAAGAAAPPWRDSLESLLASPELDSCDTYLESFEIGAKAPLYLGHYLFEEPKSCHGAATCGRNGYMIQLKNLYGHFGLQIDGGELPDFLPLLLDFLALTAGHRDQKRRRWLIQRYIQPALPAVGKALKELNNVYSPAADLLLHLINEELAEPSDPQPPGVTTAGELENAIER
jgi:nitrate reductase delta subunit